MSIDAADPTAAELEDLAIRLAQGAAQLIASATVVSADVSAKSTATDLVTRTDRQVERWLSAELAAARPADSLLGEEGGASGGSSAIRWLLDPIDGTVNFVLGLPQYAVSIAAEREGTVVAGAVGNPVNGEIFHAHLGGGAWLGSTRLNRGRSIALESAVIGTGFGYDRAQRIRQAAVVAQLLGKVGDIRRLGAASLDVCAVAAGRLDGYFEAGLNIWDHAAGGLIAAEAGCVVAGLHGQAPSSRMVVVAPPEWANEFLSLLEQLGADEVSENLSS